MGDAAAGVVTWTGVKGTPDIYSTWENEKMSGNSKVSLLGALSVVAILSGCAGTPVNQPLSQEIRPKIGSTQTYIGLKQSELYAAINPSMIGQSAAAGCGAVPGLGILLAAACGAAGGAMDATINAARAKDAEEAVRPLKDTLLDISFDDQFHKELAQALTPAANQIHVSNIAITKQTSDGDYEKLIRDSTADAVLLVSTDYHMSPDFTSLLISTRSFIFPRSSDLRALAGQEPDLSKISDGAALTKLDSAIYRGTLVYEAHLPDASEDQAHNIENWQQSNGLLLRKALTQGMHEVAANLATDLVHTAPTESIPGTEPETIKINGLDAIVISKNDDGTLVRMKDDSLKFIGNLGPASTASAEPASAPTNTATAK